MLAGLSKVPPLAELSGMVAGLFTVPAGFSVIVPM